MKEKIGKASVPQLTSDEIMLLLNCGVDNADVLSQMLLQAKKKYVDKIHPYAVFQIAKGAKAGRWKTYIGKPRKEVTRGSEQELYEYLYEIYREENKKKSSFKAVYEERLQYLLIQKNRSEKTIIDYRSIYNRFVPARFGSMQISSIEESDVMKLVQSVCRNQHPKTEALKKFVQALRATFDFALRFGYCLNNPVQYVDISCYYKDCDLNVKQNEEKEFSQEEIDALMSDAEKNQSNPRALMMMLANETGMRAGELAALHRSDIEGEYLHIHRQQLIDETKKGSDRFHEVPYTKDERMHPHGGRYFPINLKMQHVFALAEQIPGESDYIFHDPDNSGPVSKDTYERYLKRRCMALKINATNNHAFRIALNGRFIDLGLNPAERALLLGHAVQTNEQHYSLTDRRQLKSISEKLDSGFHAPFLQFGWDKISLTHPEKAPA